MIKWPPPSCPDYYFQKNQSGSRDLFKTFLFFIRPSIDLRPSTGPSTIFCLKSRDVFSAYGFSLKSVICTTCRAAYRIGDDDRQDYTKEELGHREKPSRNIMTTNYDIFSQFSAFYHCFEVHTLFRDTSILQHGSILISEDLWWNWH